MSRLAMRTELADVVVVESDDEEAHISLGAAAKARWRAMETMVVDVAQDVQEILTSHPGHVPLRANQILGIAFDSTLTTTTTKNNGIQSKIKGSSTL